jgi:hypothetical protein
LPRSINTTDIPNCILVHILTSSCFVNISLHSFLNIAKKLNLAF